MGTHLKETVLVIDDEPVVVDVSRVLLSEEGFEVGSASGGTEGDH
jgi:CheY-like chemotaxis protein